MDRPKSTEQIGFAAAMRVWAKIGVLSFGGPAGQIALMHRELVEKRRWISETRFLHALNYCMLLPGPEAQQLATYIGWLLHKTPGGIVAGGLFVLPGCVAMLVLSALYVAFGQLPATTALFFGLKAAVLAIVVEAVVRIGRRALQSGLMVAVAAAAFVAIFFFKVPFPWLIVGAGAFGALAVYFAPRSFADPAARDARDDERFLIDRLHAEGRLTHTRPSGARALRITVVCLLLWFAPVALVATWLGANHVITREGLFFSQTAIVTFGGAYAVLAYVAQHASSTLHWIAPGQMLDGLALAETTPGPLIMVLQFVGFVAAYRYPAPLDPWVAAVLGALLTTWVTFLPSFMFIFVGAPYMEAVRRRRSLSGALAAITAAVVGVILNLSAWFALHTVFARIETRRLAGMTLDVPVWSSIDFGALVLSIAALIAMLRFKLGMGPTLLASAMIGSAYWWWRHGAA
jgi:chromate transporter